MSTDKSGSHNLENPAMHYPQCQNAVAVCLTMVIISSKRVKRPNETFRNKIIHAKDEFSSQLPSWFLSIGK